MGAKIEPHEYPYLRVSVAATLEVEGGRAPDRFGQARVGLPLEYIGGVLVRALQEPGVVGPGTLTFDHAAVHEIDSSWDVFRLLAIGVVRLLGLPSGGRIPRIFCRESAARHQRQRVPAESAHLVADPPTSPKDSTRPAPDGSAATPTEQDNPKHPLLPQCARTGWLEDQRLIARLRSAIAARHASQASAKSLG